MSEKNIEEKLDESKEEISPILEHSTRIDVAKYSEFLSVHNRCSPNPRAPKVAVQADYSYKYTPTSVGTKVDVTCLRCKETKDITDYDCW